MRQQRHRAFLAGCTGLALATALAVAGITRTGYSIEMAVLRFLLLYAGVFALIGLTAAVGVGLLATDRIIMLPGGRIIAQAVHRAVSFGAVGFLVVHIAVEVVIGRSLPDDIVVPFLDHGRTLYLGFGTVASDLVVLIIVTGIMRGRFAAAHPPWTWRALHATAYLSWPLAILHGLLAGRTAKPYVDWSYGACVAVVGLALVIRVVGTVRVREMAGAPVPALGPWLPGGAVGSPLEAGASLPLAFGGRERLAIAAPPDASSGHRSVPYEDGADEPGRHGYLFPAPDGVGTVDYTGDGEDDGGGDDDGGDYGAGDGVEYHLHGYDLPAHYRPAFDVPAFDMPAYDMPGYGHPVSGHPVYDHPVSDHPVSDGYGREPYDADLYGPEPSTDPRMYAPPPEAWPARAEGGRDRWAQ
jgi:hypothetical protein